MNNQKSGNINGLTGRHVIAGVITAAGDATFTVNEPATGAAMEPFFEATAADVDQAMNAAEAAFPLLRATPPAARATFLDKLAAEIEALGDPLIERAHRETALPLARLQSERGRTLAQARAFAAVVREGSWVGARIDRAQADRQPLPKPDVRAMLTGIGPVVVFGASNFPLAISVAGTDTVSALAAGCPVVVKAHPAHPGTSEMIAGAFVRALAACGLPAGAFSMLHGQSHVVGLALVKHHSTRAVAFTGSYRGGRALFDAAAARPDPIPVFAEMGSSNPVFVLPGALQTRAAEMARAFFQSLTMGVGQFCTNPGLVFGIEAPALDAFVTAAGAAVEAFAPATMLNAGIRAGYEAGVQVVLGTPGVTSVARSKAAADPARTEAAAHLATTSAATFRDTPGLSHEVFGPSSLVVRCPARGDLLDFARRMDGQLTASIHGTPQELADFADLVAILETKVGRIIFNGFGTGIEVCPSMHHGGPFPATTGSQFTSIGHAAIFRFARPVAYQNFPDASLPAALRDGNPLGLWRLVDGGLSRESW
jgi:NADP-dependent aldehyde dehydrogenase